MTDRLNWGLLSTARINRALIPPLRKSRRNELAAVASRNLEHAQEYAREWKIPKAYGSYQELLDSPEIDVIYNSLPNHLHAEWSIKAAQAGKHVLCEKPLGLSVEEVDAMARAAKENGVVIAEAFMYRHHPQTKKVIEMVKSGEIGKLITMRGAFTFKINRPVDIRLVPEYGGGSIWDVGCYPISYFRALTGAPPEEVFGDQRTSNGGIDCTFAGQMRYSGGVIAQFESSFELPSQAYIEIRGSDGNIFIPLPFKPAGKPRIQLIKNDTVMPVSFEEVELYSGEIEDMFNAVNGRPQLISLEESRDNIATLQALLESAAKGQVISLQKA